MRSLQLAVCVAAVLGVSGVAYAYDSGNGVTTGDIVLVVYDGNQSLVEVLTGSGSAAAVGNYGANTLSSLSGSSPVSDSWNINLTGFNLATTRFFVAADSVTAATRGLEISAPTVTGITGGNVNTSSNKLMQYISNVMTTIPCTSPCVAPASDLTKYFGDGTLGNSSVDFSNALNSSSSFFQLTSSGRSSTLAATQYTGTLGAGTWTLADLTTGSTGTLTYSYGTVPLPAAAWLLGSGLLGLGGIARRRSRTA
jgi:hypothetical protein